MVSSTKTTVPVSSEAQTGTPSADLNSYRRLHLVGIGGAGMSALAKLLAGRGWQVSGSDIRTSAILAGIRDLGIEIWTGHQPDRISGVDLVVASSAVPDQDPELVTAHSAQIPVWRRPQLLSALSAQQPTIGATGSHGKTTTTTLLAEIFRSAGLDPSVVVGAEMLGWGSNALVGTDPWLIVEVDEAFSTFSHIQLSGLIVTNVGNDHLLHFGTMDDLENAFVQVVRSVEGPVVACLDDPGSARVAERTGVATYGTDPEATFRLNQVSSADGQISFTLESDAFPSVSVTVPRTGLHMALNAAGAISLAQLLGLDGTAAAQGVAGFSGVRRRFEVKGNVAGVTFVDDYAHHPTEIAATIKAARSGHSSRVLVVFQPHLFSRTDQLQHELGQSLSLADQVWVTEVFAAREPPIPGVTGELVVNAARRWGTKVKYLPGRTELIEQVLAALSSGDLLITMGAGDITLLSDQLLRRWSAGPEKQSVI